MAKYKFDKFSKFLLGRSVTTSNGTTDSYCYHVRMGDSRKYPYHNTDGFHILTPPAFGSSKMRYPPMPLAFDNHKAPPSVQIFHFFCHTLRNYLQGSLICPIWLILWKIISNDSTSVSTAGYRESLYDSGNSGMKI